MQDSSYSRASERAKAGASLGSSQIQGRLTMDGNAELLRECEITIQRCTRLASPFTPETERRAIISQVEALLDRLEEVREQVA
jgi:hypothetical protein